MIISKFFVGKERDELGNFTIFVKINNCKASIPSGTSKSSFEYSFDLGREIKREKEILRKLKGKEINDVKDILEIDRKYRCLPISLALLKCLAKEKKREVYQLLCKRPKKVTFVTKIFGGGKHSIFEIPSFQEFLIFPNLRGEESYKANRAVYNEAIRYVKKKKVKWVKDKEGGIAIRKGCKEILNILLEIIDKVKESFSGKIFIGIDFAASSYYKKGFYNVDGKKLEREEYISYLEEIIREYKIRYIEDPVSERDAKGYLYFKKKFKKALVVGDDLIATRLKRLEKLWKFVNAVIVKPNQNFSLVETIEFCKRAKRLKLKRVFSHRSKETFEKVFADLATCFSQYYKISFSKARLLKIRRVIEIEKKSFKIKKD